MNIPTLDTERLTLRAFAVQDFDAYAQMCADPQFMRFLLGGKPLAKEDAWRNLAFIQGHWALLGYGIWAVETRQSRALIGTAGLLNPDGWPGLEVCWALAPRHWGHGFATEAVKAVIDWTFASLEVDRLISLIHPDNHRSAAVAARVGESLRGQLEFKETPLRIYEILRPGR